MPARGFIALTSVLIISAVLFLLASGGSFAGFYARENSLRYEYKEQSEALAYACIEHTLLALANDSTYRGGATTTVSTGACYTKAFADPSGSPSVYTFRTRAYIGSGAAYTSLETVAKSSDFSVVSVSEVPTF